MIFRKTRNYFLAGLLVTVPIGITVWIVWSIFNLLDGWYRYLVRAYGIRDYLTSRNYTLPEYGIGFFVTLALITLIGFVTQLYVGRKLFDLIEQIFLRLPVISNLYNGIKQITATLMGRHKNIFERVVLVEYPRKGLYSLGFVTGRDRIIRKPDCGGEFFYVYIPKTPNAATGVFLIVPDTETVPMNISVEEAIKMIVSGGMVSPNPVPDVSLDVWP
ncbi:MAG TPA: DUF502 domain-containing protein [bacterium]|nr:DUF502 domain-containing protein [Candidatus Omnitrophota bacterium]HOJ62203.1 DUF502 domain-containing protein [bacterium]HOL95636.1 DUF502 domain-containing protein [bacterium]HPO99746.1 DUF502 domain-containing protein [bacterium]HXK94234.1 DUF502 domain-containing protein [bacterium]